MNWLMSIFEEYVINYTKPNENLNNFNANVLASLTKHNLYHIKLIK